MASFAYGYMGEYTDKLVFINVIIGKILRFLIQLFPHVPWYALSQCAIIYASFTVIVFLMWAEGHEVAKKKEIAKMKAKDI